MEKRMKIWVLVGAAVVIAIALCLTLKNMSPETFNNYTTNQSATESSQDISVKDTGAAAAPISYANALAKYADRRIQLDANCQATQFNTVTYKDNTGIMIDNRSSKTHTVKIGTSFTIKPWGFKIVTLPDIYLKSKTILVDCDNSQNVATILVQE